MVMCSKVTKYWHVAGKFSWQKDTASGLPYRTAVQRGGKSFAHCLGWVSSAVFSRDGESVAFHYRVARCAADKLPPLSFVYTIGIDGKHLWRYGSRLQPVAAPSGCSFLGCIFLVASCVRHMLPLLLR
jgi:hypothetical protein